VAALGYLLPYWVPSNDGNDSIDYHSIQPDYSPESTFKENDDSFSIDYSKCTPDKRTFDNFLTTTDVFIVGKKGQDCEMYIAVNIEKSPNVDIGPGDGRHCLVPTKNGVMKFSRKREGANFLDFSPIDQYCD
jgi:hypothetical protein